MDRARRGFFLSGLVTCFWLIFFALIVYKDQHVVTSVHDGKGETGFYTVEEENPPEKKDLQPEEETNPSQGKDDPKGHEGEAEEKGEVKDEGEEAPFPPAKTVYLTFDDGPSPVTEEIVALLRAYEIEATFFMLEPRMKRYAHGVQSIIQEGHATGLHGVTHDRRKFYRSSKSVLHEMEKARATLLKIGGVESRLIRVPYGSVPHMKPEYLQVLEEEGYILWDWNVDSRDWYYRDKRYVKEVLRQVDQVSRKGESPVVLLHDLEATYRHLPALIDQLVEKGYVFAKIREDLEPVQFPVK